MLHPYAEHEEITDQDDYSYDSAESRHTLETAETSRSRRTYFYGRTAFYLLRSAVAAVVADLSVMAPALPFRTGCR